MSNSAAAAGGNRPRTRRVIIAIVSQWISSGSVVSILSSMRGLVVCSGMAKGETDTRRPREWTVGERGPVRRAQEVYVGVVAPAAHAHLLGMAHWVVSLASHQDWVVLSGPFGKCIHGPQVQVP